MLFYYLANETLQKWTLLCTKYTADETLHCATGVMNRFLDQKLRNITMNIMHLSNVPSVQSLWRYQLWITIRYCTFKTWCGWYCQLLMLCSCQFVIRRLIPYWIVGKIIILGGRMQQKISPLSILWIANCHSVISASIRPTVGPELNSALHVEHLLW